MKLYQLSFFFLILVLSCRQNHSLIDDIEVKDTPGDTVPRLIYKEYVLDTGKIAIIPMKSPSNFYFELKLTNADLRTVDSLLTVAVNDYNGSGHLSFASDNPYNIRLANYKRQYLPFLNQNNNKIIFIQCFCEDFDKSDYWKTNLLDIDDGGSCVFGLSINLTKKTCDKISVHGVG